MERINFAMLKATREMKGLTQRQLADLSGVSSKLISALENGSYTSNPGADTLRRIGEVLRPEEPDFLFKSNIGNMSMLLKILEGDKSVDLLLIRLMKDLEDVSKTDAVGSVLASWSGYTGGMRLLELRQKGLSSLIEAIADTIQTAEFAANPHQEVIWKNLIISIEELVAEFRENDSSGGMSVFEESLYRLRQSRISNDLRSRHEALRAAFFAVYDKWAECSRAEQVGNILADIVCLLSWKDTLGYRETVGMYLFEFAKIKAKYEKEAK